MKRSLLCPMPWISLFGTLSLLPALGGAILVGDNRSVHTEANRSHTSNRYWDITRNPPQSFSDFHAAVEKTDLRSGNSDTLWGVRGSVAQTSLVSPNLFSGSGSASGDSYALFGLAIDHGFSISTFEVTFEILTPQRFELAAEVSGFSTPILTGYGNAAVMLTGPTSFQVFAGTSYGRIPSASLDVNGLLQPGSYHFFAYADAITVGNRDEDVPVVEDNSASASFDFLFRLIEPTGVPDPDVSLSTYLAVFFALGLLFPKRPGETA